MDLEKFTERAQGLIQAAQTIAMREQHQQLQSEHVLKALLDDPEGLASQLIQAAGGRGDLARNDVNAAVKALPKVQGGGDKLYMAPSLGRALDTALQAACYRAAFESIWGKPWLAGVHVWKWFTDSRDEHGPTDFSPAGKEAEDVLKEWFTR